MIWPNRLLRRLFSRKASSVSGAVYLASSGQPAWTPVNYEILSTEGYEKNVTVYSCINEIAISAAGIPFTLSRKSKGKNGPQPQSEDHPLLKLLRRPNPTQGGATFFAEFSSYLLLHGNSYMERVGPDRGPPSELWNLRPDRIKVIPDPIPGGENRCLECDPVLRS